MTYAYIIVIYVTYIQIYYYCLLGHGLPKDLWREVFVHSDFLSFFIKCLLAFDAHVHFHAIAKSNTLPLENKETHSIVLLSFASFSYILL